MPITVDIVVESPNEYSGVLVRKTRDIVQRIANKVVDQYDPWDAINKFDNCSGGYHIDLPSSAEIGYNWIIKEHAARELGELQWLVLCDCLEIRIYGVEDNMVAVYGYKKEGGGG